MLQINHSATLIAQWRALPCWHVLSLVCLLSACTPAAAPPSSPTALAPTTALTSTLDLTVTATTTLAAEEATVAETESSNGAAALPMIQEYPVPAGSRPHDVAPAPDGTVWYTGQRTSNMGRLDPATGEIRLIDLGSRSAPHGVIVGPDGAAWITDGGLNAIVRVDAESEEVQTFPLPVDRPNANLNTAAFDPNGILWFTGQNGVYGQLDPATGAMTVYDAPRGRGPYGITTTPTGSIYYASLAGSYIARVDTTTGATTVLDPPTPNQGARRVWSDSQGRIWVSEWNAGQVALYDPDADNWREWPLPGGNAAAYAVYVDEQDIVWLSDFSNNALVRFDPTTEAFTSYPLPSPNGAVRQLLGRSGEIWGAESAVDKLVVIRLP